jgi:hypothetical protein
MNLIRFHDDLWLCGKPSTCAHAWDTIKDCVRVLGLDIKHSKTGSVYISDGEKDPSIATTFPPGPVCMGMLQLSPSGAWTLDQKQVSAHVRQLRKQLGESKSIIAWTQIWNACMGQFFKNAFGKPTTCFGQPHVDAVLSTFAAMQSALFAEHNASVTAYLREQIRCRFDVSSVPDAFFFLSEDLGGLGLQNPFVPFFLLRGQLVSNPLDCIAAFRAKEKKAYKKAKQAFDALTDKHRLTRYDRIFASTSNNTSPSEPFFSFEEYTAHREVYSAELGSTYYDLMREPSEVDVHLSGDVKPLFEELSRSHGVFWGGMNREVQWIMGLYAGELKARFGALSIVNRNMLPSGVMKMVKGRRVVWQQIIWE